jgi:cytochrome c553
MRKLLLLLALLSSHSLAQNSQACGNCHGAQGEGGSTGAPALAGQSKEYLLVQLEAYASGRRQHAVMTPIAKGLSPVERDAFATHYSRLQPRARPPQLGGLESRPGGRSVAVEGKRLPLATSLAEQRGV